jgi:CheY-like chemotaxis protein
MNARDAMPRGGRLRITTANREIDADHAALHPGLQPGSYAMIEVADTGTGMAPELLSRIFEPFFTTKGFGKGTGLGLSMVFGFTHQSGGYISALSEPGAGATFRLYLPCVSGRAAIQGVTTAAVATPSRGEMVLVVEDDEALRHVVARQLGELGYRVIEAGTALDALAALEANHVDVMFSDVMMPGDMDGLALAGQAVARSPGVRILLTSGFPNAGMGSLEGSLGTSMRLLNKPYRKEELALALRAVLEAEAAWQASKVQPQATPNEFVA